MSQRSPIAVLISDIHFSIPTLEVASQALLKAQFKAKLLNVPLIIAGDLLDTKAIIRAEVANLLIRMFSIEDAPETIILVGNHDRCHERSTDHALNFLRPYATIIDSIQTATIGTKRVTMIPYSSDMEDLKSIIQDEYTSSTIIMHQGVYDSNSGHYYYDKTAISKGWLAGKRVISGHYHTRQSFDLPEGGQFDYIGNPYTLNFGEVNDPEKGYQILYADGTLEFIPTELRKHLIINIEVTKGNVKFMARKYELTDILWVKVTGPTDILANVTKREVAGIIGVESFKLDLVPTDTQVEVSEKRHSMTQSEILDSMIDTLSNTDDSRKVRLKELWKQFA